MNLPVAELGQLCGQNPKLLSKGGLCVALVVTRHAKEKGLPLDFKSLRTEQGGQVIGLGKAAVQKILKSHEIEKVLAEEGGRTNRGSLGLMKEYVGFLNALHQKGPLDIAAIEAWWVEKVRTFPVRGRLRFRFDPQKSLGANIAVLLAQMEELPSKFGPSQCVTTMLHNLVRAKLDLMPEIGQVKQQRFNNVVDSASRHGDFEINSYVIHVAATPNDALIQKCADNLKIGLQPLIVTTTLSKIATPSFLGHSDALGGTDHVWGRSKLRERVEVIDCAQFLTTNLYLRSLFVVADCKTNLIKLLERYNQIVDEDKSHSILRVELN